MPGKRKELTCTITSNGCFEVASHKPKSNGYIYIRTEQGRISVHRYIYTQTHGPIPDGLVVRHTCDNRICINPAHLLIGTQADNMKDRSDRMRHNFGERNGGAKLTEDQVKSIKSTIGKTHRELARRYGIDRTVVTRIKSGQAWKRIQSA